MILGRVNFEEVQRAGTVIQGGYLLNEGLAGSTL